MININKNLQSINFKNRRILITGASRGLGAAVYEWLINENANVLAIGRGKPDFEVLKKNSFLKLDLSEQLNVEELIKRTINFQPDTIIHCLGGGFKKSNDLISKSDLLYLLNMNFIIGLEINNAILPSMIKNKKGWIIHFSSIATKEITASVGYTCVKSLIEPYVKLMGRKYIVDNIYISGIILGAISGNNGALDRLSKSNNQIYEKFIKERRPTLRSTPINELLSYLNLLLSENAKIHSSNMITLDEAEGISL